MRRLLAYMFIAIFSFQVLPVKEIGKILFKGQITEEEVAGHNCGGDHSPVKLKKDGDPLHFNAYLQDGFRVEHLTHDVSVAVQQSERLPSHFVADIVTPPPNRA